MTMTPSVLATGLQGLVGSKLSQTFGHAYTFQNIDIHDPKNPIDITNAQQVMETFRSSSAEFVVHFAAFTDVTAAWNQRGDKNGLAYQVNVVGTENIVKAAAATQKHLIHISTAYVFDGQKNEPYTENDSIHPIEWYGETKAAAEQLVQESHGAWTILRIDQPFRSDSFPKADLVRKMVSKINQSPTPSFFNDHFFGPTYIDDFAKVIEWVFRTKTTGLFHASSGEQWSDFDFAQALCAAQSLSPNFTAGSLADYLKTSVRPYQKNTALNCEKLKKTIDFKMLSINEALKTVLL